MPGRLRLSLDFGARIENFSGAVLPLSHATMHLIDLMQTRIQVEIEDENAIQIQVIADREASPTQVQVTIK